MARALVNAALGLFGLWQQARRVPTPESDFSHQRMIFQSRFDVIRGHFARCGLINPVIAFYDYSVRIIAIYKIILISLYCPS